MNTRLVLPHRPQPHHTDGVCAMIQAPLHLNNNGSFRNIPLTLMAHKQRSGLATAPRLRGRLPPRPCSARR